jgi:hypothetical protein
MAGINKVIIVGNLGGEPELNINYNFSWVSSFPVFFVLVSLKFPFNINFRAFVAITAHN